MAKSTLNARSIQIEQRSWRKKEQTCSRRPGRFRKVAEVAMLATKAQTPFSRFHLNTNSTAVTGIAWIMTRRKDANEKSKQKNPNPAICSVHFCADNFSSTFPKSGSFRCNRSYGFRRNVFPGQVKNVSPETV